jgi:hypothetical protein
VVWDIEQRAQKYPKTDITQFAALPPAPSDRGADLVRLWAEGELQFATGQRPALMNGKRRPSSGLRSLGPSSSGWLSNHYLGRSARSDGGELVVPPLLCVC